MVPWPFSLLFGSDKSGSESQPLAGGPGGKRHWSPAHVILCFFSFFIVVSNMVSMWIIPRNKVIGHGIVSQLTFGGQHSYLGAANHRTVDYYTDGVCVHPESGSGTTLESTCGRSGFKCGDELDTLGSACWIPYGDFDVVKCANLEYKEQASVSATTTTSATVETNNFTTLAKPIFNLGEIEFQDDEKLKNLPCILAGCDRTKPTEPGKGEKCADLASGDVSVTAEVNATVATTNSLQRGLLYKTKYVFNVLTANGADVDRKPITATKHRDNTLNLGKWFRRLNSFPTPNDAMLINIFGGLFLFFHTFFIVTKALPGYTGGKFNNKSVTHDTKRMDMSTFFDLFSLIVWVFFVLVGISGCYRSDVGHWQGARKIDYNMISLYISGYLIVFTQFACVLSSLIYWLNNRGNYDGTAAERFVAGGKTAGGPVFARQPSRVVNVELSQRASMVRNNLDV